MEFIGNSFDKSGNSWGFKGSSFDKSDLSAAKMPSFQRECLNGGLVIAMIDYQRAINRE